MNILLLANKFPYPPKDGGVIAKLAMIKGLYEQGHSITVLALNTSKHYTDLKTLPDGIRKLANFQDVYINTDIKASAALKNLLFSTMPYNAERFISKTFIKKLTSILKKNKFDIVQLETLYMCPYIETIRAHSNAKISYRAHNIEHEIWKRVAANESNPIKKIYSKILAKRIERFEKLYINKYDCLIPITSKDEHNLHNMGNTKPSLVCPTGISSEEYIPETNSHPMSVFHLGGLDWPPNQQGLVWFIDECLPLIVKEIEDFTFHIGGRNAPEWLKEKFAESEKVIFHGEVDDAHEYMRSKGIMISPLLAGSGMRIKIIEGMALGKAIVSTAIGAEGIPYTDGENICIGNSAHEFVERIVFLLKNRTDRNRIAENAVNFVRDEFDNRKISERLSAFFISIT